jgi:hypothetical protein
MPKTRITLITGETFDIEMEKDDFIKEITNEFDHVGNWIVNVNDKISILSSHIVKIEKLKD